MARTKEEALRGCPLCGTPVSKADLGLRDFEWLEGALPAKVGASDIDFCLQQEATHRALYIEFKPYNERIPVGQKLLLRHHVRNGGDVWVVWHNGDGKHVTVGAMDKNGNVPFSESMSVRRLKRTVKKWWEDGFED